MDKNVLSGANVSFYCVGFADPPPEIIWEKNSKGVESSDRIKVVAIQGSAELRLSSVTVVDAGVYSCIYKNTFGEVRRSAKLTVDGQSGTGQQFIVYSSTDL